MMSEQKINLIKPIDCITPRFLKQNTYKLSGRYDLPEEDSCSVVIIENVLNKDELDNYIREAVKVERVSGISGYGKMKPRKELLYYVEGDEPYKYSGVKHKSIIYPGHVRIIEEKLLSRFEEMVPENKYKQLSHGIDIEYSNEFERGGSIGCHSDDEMDWGLVIVYTLGQSRWFRVRHKSTGAWHNVKLAHNSLVAMYGANFQKRYTHQIDKLNKDEEVGIRLSLNIRYL